MRRFGVMACVLGLSVLAGPAALAAEGPVPLSTCSSRYAQSLAQTAPDARDWKTFSKSVCGVENWRVPGVHLSGVHLSGVRLAGPHVVRASLVVREPRHEAILRPVSLRHGGLHHAGPHHRPTHHRHGRM